VKTALHALLVLAQLLGAGVLAVQVARSQAPQGPITPLPSPQGGNARRIALGRDLFFDRRLSRSTRLSCASCHDLATNGASGARVDRGDAGRLMRFNTPTVYNSGLNYRMGWQGRARTLHQAALGTLRDANSMGGAGIGARRLAADRAMVARFASAYHAPPSDEAIADALALFMGTLVTPDAPFDRFLRGDPAALTSQQKRGASRFVTLGCASCHQGANVGGNLRQRRGIFHPLGEVNPTHLRVPSLRNVAVTGPYFHDGSAGTLPVAIRRMARAQLDLKIDDRDVQDISAFLNTLTGTYQGRPLPPASSVER
jgi:cytochrome c peroxidase